MESLTGFLMWRHAEWTKIGPPLQIKTFENQFWPCFAMHSFVDTDPWV